MEEKRSRAFELALRRLNVREYSSGEMALYLKRKNVDAEEAEEVLKSLIRDGFVDDQRYAKILVRHELMRDKGPVYIFNKLRRKGVRIELRQVKELYAEHSQESELQLAEKIVNRRYPDYENDPKERHRAFQALIRRGFSKDTAYRCLFSGQEEESL